jgi:CheY-like chemotaxis protein
MRRAMARLLQSWGHQVAVAADIPHAIALADTFRPDVAILDLALGETTGLNLAMQLRQRFPERRLRLVAMTADNDADARKACLTVFDAYLVKPAQLNELERILRPPN